MAYVHVISNLTSSLPRRATSSHGRRLRLSTLARKHGLDPRAVPVICSRNGQWISQKQWRRVCARRDDVVVFCVMPRGGGLRVAAMLGILLAATVIGGPFGTALGASIFGAGLAASAVGALTTAGLVIGANYLLNVLVPVKPAGDQQQLTTGSPTYARSLSVQNNLARLGGPMPVLYGRVRFVPDLGSAPWVEWVQQQQILRQVFVLTQGDMDVEKVELGLTNVTAFDQATATIYAANDLVNVFPPEVFTSTQVTNLVLTPPNDPDVSPGGSAKWFSVTTYGAGDVVFTDQFTRIYWSSVAGGNLNHNPLLGGGFWVNLGSSPPGFTLYKGPFPACPPGETTGLIGVDLSLPAGLYLLNQATGNPDPLSLQWTFECQEIDDNGTPVGNWTFLDSEVADSTGGALVTPAYGNSQYMGGGYEYVAQRTQPINFSFRITMPSSARWQIRAYRNDTKGLTGTVGHDVMWTGLRGFLADSHNYKTCTVLALEIVGGRTGSVNDQSSRQVAVTGTRKLPTWNGSTWSANTATRSIAWAVADMLKNADYGGKRSDTDYDLAGLYALHGTWDPRPDYFDYYFAQPLTLWQALSMALRAGRAVAYHQSGIVRFHRDGPQSVPTMLFSNENIVKGSFQMNFIHPSPEDETDSVQVDYVNEDTWLQDSLILAKPGVGTPVAPSINQLDGVVQTVQANNELYYLQAADQYRRVLVSFDTELEGLIASRGDLILIHHDMPRWGQSTRVYDWDVGTLTVTLWGRLDFGDFSGSWLAYFRDRFGAVSDTIPIVSYDDDTLTMVLAYPPVYVGSAPFDMVASGAEPLHVVVGQSDTLPRQAIFLSATPRNGKIVSVTAVLENPLVHVN